MPRGRDDGTGIERVEVKVDEGQWQVATLDDAPRAEFSWVFFSNDLDGMKQGKHTIVSRAIASPVMGSVYWRLRKRIPLVSSRASRLGG